MLRFRTSVTAVLLAAAAALVGPAASAADHDVRGNRPIYLALGDSLAAGQQSAPPTGDVESTLARWRASGFVAQFHGELRDDLDCRTDRKHGRHQDSEQDRAQDRGHDRDGCPRLQLVNLSRTGIPGVPGSGVTTATVLADGDQLEQAVALIRERNGDASSRNDVEVVSLTVGGNDLFTPAFAACVASPSPATTCAPALAVTFAGFGERYAQILAALRAAGGPGLVILTTTYFNPLPFCDPGTRALGVAGATVVGDAILEGGTVPGVGVIPTGFNDLVRAVSAGFGATAVDTFGVLGAGDLVGGEDCLHPDADGHEEIADVFADTFPG